MKLFLEIEVDAEYTAYREIRQTQWEPGSPPYVDLETVAFRGRHILDLLTADEVQDLTEQVEDELGMNSVMYTDPDPSDLG